MTDIPIELPPRSPRQAEILSAARRRVEAEGWDALSMRTLAADLGIRAPSLYKHLPNKDAVRTQLLIDAFAQMGRACWQVIEDGAAVPALLRAYRATAAESPELYRLATRGPLDRAALPDGLEEWSGQPFFLITGDAATAQALWAAAHGLTILQLDDRLPPGSDIDAAWGALAEAFA
ncbi:TetR/AcrR family transcriptional regulator [Brevibacterium luteolum]|uniref:TetR/AcrR family transcriptional regulator n=1 Tax=Brevibacterium luteolum TaxID=199591 RepID=UPI0038793322